jgi:predicted nucleotidyltransferase
MTSSDTAEAALPAVVREGQARLCTQLQETFGKQLVSVVLYGGLAKGEYVPDTSDVNVMIVLDEVTVSALDKAAPIIQGCVRDFRLSAMLLSESDLRRSTEVFPVKFLDMQRHHRILWGKEVFAGLTIARDFVRLRCAQEITNLLLRLRQFYVQRAHRPELIESTLTRAISSFLTSLNTLVELKAGQEAPTKSAVIEAAEKIGLDGQALRDVFALKRGELKPNPEELKRLYDLFMTTVQQAAALVDTV